MFLVVWFLVAFLWFGCSFCSLSLLVFSYTLLPVRAPCIVLHRTLFWLPVVTLHITFHLASWLAVNVQGFISSLLFDLFSAPFGNLVHTFLPFSLSSDSGTVPKRSHPENQNKFLCWCSWFLIDGQKIRGTPITCGSL